jgi:xylulokinase
MHVIGLDIGTTGCKAMIIDPEGIVKGYSFIEYNIISNEPNMAEQDAEHVWQLVKEALGKTIRNSGIREISAMSISVQGDAIIPINKDCRAIYPAILGMDYRSAKQAEECETLCGDYELFATTGMRPHPMNSLVKILWLKENRPEIYKQAWKIATYADFILGKLGAEPVIDFTMASRTMAFDLYKKEWSSLILEKCYIDPSFLSRAVPSGEVSGTLKPSIASEVGISSKVLLVTGGHDQTCAALGAGVVDERRGVVSTGSAEVMSAAFESPKLGHTMYQNFYPCYVYAKNDMYFTFSLNHTGGILFKWYRDHLAYPELARSKETGSNAYDLIIDRMKGEPSPIMILPHHNGSGTPWCDTSSKGAIVGMTLSTTRHHISRAILEGLTFELRINREKLKEAGVTFEDLVAVGGGAKSSAWLQLKADILGCPVTTLKNKEASCLGAALLAAKGAGIYSSLDEGVKRTVHIDQIFAPNESLRTVYDERFTIYKELYPALKSINRKL